MKARAIVRNFLESEGSASAIGDDVLENDLFQICRHYWSDRDFDNRMSLAEVRVEISKLEKLLKKSQDAIIKLSPLSRGQLVTEIKRSNFGDGVALLNSFNKKIHSLIYSCKPLLMHKRTATNERHFGKLFKRLMSLRENFIGKQFTRTWSEKFNDYNVAVAFINPDAQFLLEVMRCIDPNIEFLQVYSEGKNLAKTERSRNR